MGFDTLTGWSEFHDAAQTIADTPGVFASVEEEAAFLRVLEAVVFSKKDEAKRMALITDLTSAASGGGRAALEAVPWIGSILKLI